MLHGNLVKKCVDQAFEWVSVRRKVYSANDDVWKILHNFSEVREELVSAIISGEYEFAPKNRYKVDDETHVSITPAKDAIVEKTLALILERYLRKNYDWSDVTHVKGSGGTKGAVRRLKKKIDKYPFVLKSDIKSYYATIDHEIIYKQIENLLPCPKMVGLIWKSIRRVEIYQTVYSDIEVGLRRASPLSPILGAIYLMPLDAELKNKQCFYIRYMDDFLILAPNRYVLRHYIKKMYEACDSLNLKIAQNKTYIGRTTKGFDFLGYFFQSGKRKLRLASKTLTGCRSRVHKLYEQNAGIDQIIKYLKNYASWAKGGLSKYVSEIEIYQQIYDTILLNEMLRYRGQIQHSLIGVKDEKENLAESNFVFR